MVMHELIVISALIYCWDCDFWDYNLFTNIQRKNYDFYKCLEVCVFFGLVSCIQKETSSSSTRAILLHQVVESYNCVMNLYDDYKETSNVQVTDQCSTTKDNRACIIFFDKACFKQNRKPCN